MTCYMYPKLQIHNATKVVITRNKHNTPDSKAHVLTITALDADGNEVEFQIFSDEHLELTEKV